MREIIPGRVYWFAETDEPPPRYATVTRVGWPVTVDADPLKAARFETRDECLAFCCGVYARACLPPVSPVEHMFMDAVDATR